MKPQGLIILLAFLTVSILGFSSIAHESHATHHSCLFDLSSTCAQVVDPISSTLEHFGNLQNSIQANLNQSGIFALLLIAFSLIIGALISAKIKLKLIRYSQKSQTQFSENLFEFKSRFLAWLSILNKRYPLALISAR